jgi:hypothetical protein
LRRALAIALLLTGCTVVVTPPATKPTQAPSAGPAPTPARYQLDLRFSGKAPADWLGVPFKASLILGNGGTNLHYVFNAEVDGRKLEIKLWETPQAGKRYALSPNPYPKRQSGATLTFQDVEGTAGTVTVTSVGERREEEDRPVGLRLEGVQVGDITADGEGLALIHNF